MKALRSRWFPAVAGLLVLVLAGCGGGGGRDLVSKTILSDPTVDADVTQDLASGALSTPSVASVTGTVLSGLTFPLPSGASVADTRGFLDFPLGTIPIGATVQFASLSIFLNDVTFSDPALRAPFFLDLIDSTAFPPPIVSGDYFRPPTPPASRGFDFLNTDQGHFVEIEVTSLMQQAQLLGLPSFRVRIGFDDAVFQSDLTTTRGLVTIDDAAAQTAPLLRVEYF